MPLVADSALSSWLRVGSADERLSSEEEEEADRSHTSFLNVARGLGKKTSNTSGGRVKIVGQGR